MIIVYCESCLATEFLVVFIFCLFWVGVFCEFSLGVFFS